MAGIGRAVLAGAAGGVAGAAAMAPIFLGAERAGAIAETPPERVIDRAAERASPRNRRSAPEPARGPLALAGHLLYGAGAGIPYALLRRRWPLPWPAAGAGYGLALWAAGYLGWMPAAGVWSLPWRQRPGHAVTPLLAHLAYGLALGGVVRGQGAGGRG